jgi:PAS domain S-box-containing protein
VLLIEDEPLTAEALTKQVEHLGYTVCGVAQSAEEALEYARAVRIDLALLDIGLAGAVNGLDLAPLLRGHDIPIIFVSAQSDPETIKAATDMRPHGYLMKPVHPGILSATLSNAVARIAAERKLVSAERRLSATLDCIRDGVLVTDRELRISLTNPAAERLTGLSETELIGRTLNEVLRLSTEDGQDIAIEQLIERTFTEGSIAMNPNVRAYLHTQSGATIAVSVALNCLRETSGRASGLVCSLGIHNEAEQEFGTPSLGRRTRARAFCVTALPDWKPHRQQRRCGLFKE